MTEETKGQDETKKEIPLTTLYAFTVTGPDGREMIASFQEPDGTVLAMVTFSKEKVEAFKPVAQTIADGINRPVNLVKFEKRTEVEKITPAKVVQLH